MRSCPLVWHQDSLRASVRLTSIAYDIVPIGLALIVYELVSVLTLIAGEIMPVGLALIVHKLVSVLTSIAYMISCPLVWHQDSLRASVRLTSTVHEIVPIGLALEITS